MTLCLAYLLSCTLILAAAVGDLWLDEIWSIQFARAAGSPIEILTRFHHDNNHVLNTLFLWSVGVQNTLFVYRLFAVVSGMMALLLVGYLARAWGASEALLAVVLTGTSYPLVLYFSEARGYAPAIMFGLLSYALLRGNWCVFNPYRMIAFWTASVLGILSHLSFVIVSLALVLASLANAVLIEGPHGRRLIGFLAYHVPPFAFLGWFYVFFAREMVIGGGPLSTNWDVITQASTLAVRVSRSRIFRWLGSPLSNGCVSGRKLHSVPQPRRTMVVLLFCLGRCPDAHGHFCQTEVYCMSGILSSVFLFSICCSRTCFASGTAP